MAQSQSNNAVGLLFGELNDIDLQIKLLKVNLIIGLNCNSELYLSVIVISSVALRYFNFTTPLEHVNELVLAWAFY